MKTESRIDSTKALVQQFLDAIHGPDPTEARRYCAPECVFEALGQPARGFDEHIRMAETFNQAFSDAKLLTEDWTGEGDLIGCRWTYNGTHTGAFNGIPATGKRVVLTGIGMMTVRDGLVVAHRGEGDLLGFLQQLGVAPAA